MLDIGIWYVLPQITSAVLRSISVTTISQRCNLRISMLFLYGPRVVA
jgi:hypothetical protein